MEQHETGKVASFQFLQQLAAQPKAQRLTANQANTLTFVGVLIGREQYYIPVDLVQDVIPRPKISPVGHAQSWMAGIVKVHGEIYSVFDIESLLGNTLSSNKDFVIALSMVGGNYAILVSSVLEMAKVIDSQENDEVLDSTIQTEGFTKKLQTPDGEAVQVLQLSAMFESDAFANASIF